MTHVLKLPDRIESEVELDDVMSRPSGGLVRSMAELEGDLLVLGAGGKIGFTLATMADRAAREAGTSTRVIAVSRFTDRRQEEKLTEAGIETISCDLLDREALERLPSAGNVVHMAGRKFGSTGGEALTWTMNAFLPGLVAERFPASRIVVFSTGNVYPFVPVDSGGATERTPPAPVGEYAQSCLGRERIFEYFSEKNGTPVALARLNYAIDLRYGVLLDLAQAVWERAPIDLRMSHVNVIWQGDACDMILRSFDVCGSPARVLNVTGPEPISVRAAAHWFGEIFGRRPVFEYEEEGTALLASSTEACRLFGFPSVSLERMISWVAHWVQIGGPTLDKPTHFAERRGRF
jgi:nucleoside-diphosphate-sugar epimerase